MSLAETPPCRDVLKAYNIFEAKIYPLMRQSEVGCWVCQEDFIFQPNGVSTSPSASIQGTIIISKGILSAFGLAQNEEARAVSFLMNATSSQPGVSTGCDGFSFRSVIAQATGPRVFNRDLRVMTLSDGKEQYQIDTTIKTSIPTTVPIGPFPLGRLFIEDRKSAITGKRLRKLRTDLGPRQIATQGRDLLGIPIEKFFTIKAPYVDLNQIAGMRARQRDVLDQKLDLEPTRQTGPYRTYNLGQTGVMRIPEGGCLVIDNHIHENPLQSHHFNSRFLDPGFTGPIRTEIETAGEPEFLWVHAYNL